MNFRYENQKEQYNKLTDYILCGVRDAISICKSSFSIYILDTKFWLN